MAAERTAPSLVVLHGHGDDGRSARRLGERLGLGWSVLAAEAPVGADGVRSWFDVSARGVERGSWSRARDVVADVVERCPPGPVVLMGFSQGAAMALSSGALDRVTSVVAFSGFLPEGEGLEPTGGPDALVLAGSEDEVVPAFLSQDAATALRAAGRDVTVVVLPGGHEVSGAALDVARRWLRRRHPDRPRTWGPAPAGGVVLASASPHRARLLAEAGVDAVIDPAGIDERAHDGVFAREGARAVAQELARRKALEVAPRHPGAWIVAADQVGVVGEGSGARLLTKCSTVDEATAQLMDLRGREHRLVNALVVMAAPRGPAVEAVDEQVVRMRAFEEDQARRYVERFRPFDSVGSYRIEDEERMAAGERLVKHVEGEHPSGVVGLPLPLLWRMFAELELRLGASEGAPRPDGG